MPRRPRLDHPGLLHHVMNRGIARRTVFETREDVRAFLALLARAVREGRIEVHAYVVMTTHFHLLLRSLDGRISETLRLLQNPYVRRFNRSRRRDGPLFRGRFRSIPVESASYVHTLVRYIDQNPVDARLVTRAEDYAYGSAHAFVAGVRRAPWLSRDLVGTLTAPLIAQGLSPADAYRQTFPPRLSPAQRRFVETRLAHQSRDSDTLDHLVIAANEEVHGWMVRKALLADHTKPGLPVADAREVLAEIAACRARGSAASVVTGPRRARSPWDLAEVALLHDLAGETFSEIARRLTSHESHAYRLYEEHRATLQADGPYGRLVSDVAHTVIQRQHRDCGADARALAELSSALRRRPSADR